MSKRNIYKWSGDTLLKLLRHYGIPDNCISLLRNTYEDMARRVIRAGQLTDSFMVKTGVWQGWLLSPFICLLTIEWITKKTTENRRNGIKWTHWSQLEDLDFADDFALLSDSHQHMQEKRNQQKCRHRRRCQSKDTESKKAFIMLRTICKTNQD